MINVTLGDCSAERNVDHPPCVNLQITYIMSAPWFAFPLLVLNDLAALLVETFVCKNGSFQGQISCSVHGNPLMRTQSLQ